MHINKMHTFINRVTIKKKKTQAHTPARLQIKRLLKWEQLEQITYKLVINR